MKHMIAEESKPDSLYGNINFSWYPSDLEDFRNRIQRTAHLPFFFLVSGAGEPITGRRLFKRGSGICNIISKLIENA